MYRDAINTFSILFEKYEMIDEIKLTKGGFSRVKFKNGEHSQAFKNAEDLLDFIESRFE